MQILVRQPARAAWLCLCAGQLEPRAQPGSSVARLAPAVARCLWDGAQ